MVKFKSWRKKHKQKDVKVLSLGEGFAKLIELKVATVKNNKYVYSSEFEETVRQLRERPPGKFEQLSLGRKIAKKMTSYLVATATVYRSKRDIENMVTAYVCLMRHLNRLGLSISESLFPSLTYATWYLNDHEPDIEEVDTEL